MEYRDTRAMRDLIGLKLNDAIESLKKAGFKENDISIRLTRGSNIRLKKKEGMKEYPPQDTFRVVAVTQDDGLVRVVAVEDFSDYLISQLTKEASETH